MSISRMVAVWDGSKQAGNSLLLLLALADHADDLGVCWPGLDRLSQRTRVSRRQITRLISELGQSGELWILERPGRTRIYVVCVGLDLPGLTGAQAKAEKLGATNTRGSDNLTPPPQVLALVRGHANLSIPPEGVKTQLCPDRQAISEGVKTQLCPDGQAIAMSPDPSITSNIDPSVIHQWGAILEDLRGQMPKEMFAAYLLGSEVTGAQDGRWTVQVRHAYAKEWLDARLRAPVDRTIERHAPGVSVEFVTREGT